MYRNRFRNTLYVHTSSNLVRLEIVSAEIENEHYVFETIQLLKRIRNTSIQCRVNTKQQRKEQEKNYLGINL